MQIDIQAVMKLPALAESNFAAGKEGRHTKVKGVTVLEITDLDGQGSDLLSIHEGDLVLSACNDIRDDLKQCFWFKCLRSAKALQGSYCSTWAR